MKKKILILASLSLLLQGLTGMTWGKTAGRAGTPMYQQIQNEPDEQGKIESGMACATLIYSLPGAQYMHKLVPQAGQYVADVIFQNTDGLKLCHDRMAKGNKYKYVSGTVPMKEGEYSYTVLLRSAQGEETRVKVRLIVSSHLQSPTPMMGWLTWNWFARSISHDRMVEIAKGMKRHGLIKAGFSTIVLDDAWALPSQDKASLTYDPKKFPKGISGLKAALKKVSGDLKLGIYSDAGVMTCENYQPGSYLYEAQHLALFDSWGVDMLKYDYCNSEASTRESYSRMGAVVDSLNRKREAEGRKPFVLNICEWGKTQPWLWGAEAGGSSWRCTSDAREDWVGNSDRPGVLGGVDETRRLWMYAGVNRFNDLDMMCIGLHGLGGPSNNIMSHMSNGGQIDGLTDAQARTQMSLWCMLASPLALTCDLRSRPQGEANSKAEMPDQLITPADIETLTNPGIIAINQDALGQQAEYMEQLSTGKDYSSEGYDVYVKDITDHRLAVAVTNRSSKTMASITLPLDSLYMDRGMVYRCREVWSKKESFISDRLVTGEIDAFETKVFVLTPIYDPSRDEYNEPTVDAKAPEAEWSALTEGLHCSWGDRNEQYQKHRVPALKETDKATLTAWRGERVNIEAVLFSKEEQGVLSVRMTGLRKDGKETGRRCAQARFMNYVITDDGRGCDNHDFTLSPWLVADVIDQDRPKSIHARETRPVWCSIEVPRDLEPGSYTTSLEVINEQHTVVKNLQLKLEVVDRQLPEPKDQRFHLDLWQQPYSVSRFYGLERWSDEHLAALRPYLQALGHAGQSVITTILFYEPWGEQSHDKFSPMIQTTRKADGSWAFDYDVFDKYVELCHECGIDKQINCYSMVTWDMKFRYYDERSSKYIDWDLTAGSDDYNALWDAYLKAFRVHLEERGWFEKTCIAMDERSEKQMLAAYETIKANGFKMALAGNYHASLNDKLHDFCVSLAQGNRFTEAERQYRRVHGLVTTVYTCCTESEPNIFSNSLPAEAAFLPIHIAANDLDGYLHWSWINWDDHPLTDSRFRKFGAGDTYCYYPGNRSSVRFERLKEGIQQYEKVQILKQEKASDTAWMDKLNLLLEECKDYSVAGTECAKKVDRLEDFLNGKEVEMPRRKAESTTLFSTRNGGMDIPPYRIPGITCGKDGRLIASNARLVCGTDPGYGQVDCVVKISKDNGETWSNKEIVVAAGNADLINNKKTPMEAAYGDPAVVMDREHNEVLVMAVGGCTVYSSPSTTRQNPNIIASIRSLDGGETWQKPIEQTEQIYGLFDDHHALEAAFIAGGRIFQSRIVKVGRYYRLYAALAARPNGNRVIYSDDFGRSWKALGGPDAAPVPDGDEPKCDELPDGRVIITSRTGGGRLMNIFTYSNTRKGEGKWEMQTQVTMNGLKVVPSSNPTNGEMLIVPVVRRNDDKEMYLVMQSMPTGNGRNNVGVFYKELDGIDDIRNVMALASGWDGFYQVSKTSSAYSSIELQEDDRIAFFYEETLTKWGTKPNPTSTSFPTGNGQHNFDGFENIYQPLELELITDGKYSIHRNINRGDFVRKYMQALIDESSMPEKNKAKAKAKVSKLPADPSPKQIDAIRLLIGK